MDNEVVVYKGRKIIAKPFQLRESKEWTLDIEIEHHYGAGVKCQSFSAKNTFQTREEAVKHCFWFGKRILDGEIKGISFE